MPDNENNLYTRIRFLEEQSCYNLPPQSNLGDYERLVREHFDQAINVDHFREIYDLEFFEKKAVLQDRLHNLMVNEKNIEQIMNLSPYDDIRREAYKFLIRWSRLAA